MATDRGRIRALAHARIRESATCGVLPVAEADIALGRVGLDLSADRRRSVRGAVTVPTLARIDRESRRK